MSQVICSAAQGAAKLVITLDDFPCQSAHVRRRGDVILAMIQLQHGCRHPPNLAVAHSRLNNSNFLRQLQLRQKKLRPTQSYVLKPEVKLYTLPSCQQACMIPCVSHPPRSYVQITLCRFADSELARSLLVRFKAASSGMTCHHCTFKKRVPRCCERKNSAKYGLSPFPSTSHLLGASFEGVRGRVSKRSRGSRLHGNDRTLKLRSFSGPTSSGSVPFHPGPSPRPPLGPQEYLRGSAGESWSGRPRLTLTLAHGRQDLERFSDRRSSDAPHFRFDLFPDLESSKP